jgi:hypothetical protein
MKGHAHRGGEAANGSHGYEVDTLMSHAGALAVEEHVHGDTKWVAIRARGAEWSWLTPQEAARLGREWVEKYGAADPHRAAPHLLAAE